MFAIQKMIGSKSLSLLAVCTLSLCLAVPALCTASSANPATRMSSIIDPPEIPLPIPPPSLYLANPAARMSSIIDPPEIPLPFPPPSLDLANPAARMSSIIDPPEIALPFPPPLRQGTMAMERTA